MDELTPDQKGALRARMSEQLDELRSLLEEAREAARPVDLDLPIGRLSRVDALQQQKMAEANRARCEQRIAALEDALVRIEREDYGECSLCGDFIAFKRLLASPEARLCLACQSRREG